MSFLLTATWLNIKKIMLQPVVWVLMFALPLGVSVVQRFDTNTLPRALVLIYGDFSTPDTLATRVLHTLQEQIDDNPFLYFVGATSLEQLQWDVQYSPSVNHGYVIPEALSYQLLQEHGVPAWVSENTLALPIVNEIVYAALLYHLLPELTVDIIHGHFPDTTAYDFVARHIAFYREIDIFMTPDMQMLSVGYNPVQELQTLSTTRLTHGIIGLAVLSVLIFVTPLFLTEKESQVLLPLPNRRAKGLYTLAIWLALVVVLSTLGTLGLFFGNFSGQNAISLFIYVLKSVIIMAGFFALFKTDNLLQNFGLFVIVANVLFGGVVLNLYEINPTLGRLQYLFPLFHYIQALL